MANDTGQTPPEQPESTGQPPAQPQPEQGSPTQGSPAQSSPTQVMPAQPQSAPNYPTGPAPLVPSGSRVIVVISRGPAPSPPTAFVAVPEVVGASQGDALGKLQEAGLSAQVFNDYSATLPRGEVMGQLPRTGQSVPTASEAVLLVSSGPSASVTAAVPLLNVVGAGEADAISRLQAAGLSPQIVREYSPFIPDGTVVDQLPNMSTLAEMPEKKSSLVWLWVLLAVLAIAAIGVGGYLWYNRTATVPNVVQLTQADAEAAITAAGFKVGAVGTTQTISAAEVGKVVTQTPSPSGQARVGSEIGIIVSGGQKLFPVPNVTGQTQANAESAIKNAGLTSQVTQAYSSTIAKGSVISQAPAADTQVPSGTAIQITVSQGPQNANVPGVVGQTQSQAQSTLKTAGLGSQAVTNFNETTPKGEVYSQYPSAGTSVAPGTVVALAISNGPPSSSTASATIPSVVGKTQSQAQSSLTSAGFKYLAVQWSGTGQAQGQVVGQTPESGVLAPKNSTVIIIVSNGK